MKPKSSEGKGIRLLDGLSRIVTDWVIEEELTAKPHRYPFGPPSLLGRFGIPKDLLVDTSKRQK